MNGFVVAAPRSGSGKTLVTLGLIAALRRRGLSITPAKTGPDYIDGTILGEVAGRDAVNLDPWAMAPDRLRELAQAQEADLLVVEGVMGLFDGAADGRGSTADLAQTLDLPIVLVLDAEKQSQSIAALAHGFLSFRPGLRFAGLIVNRAASTRHEAMLRAALAGLDVPLLGVIPRRDNLHLPERHLGLVLPSEIAAFDQVVAAAADAMVDFVDLDLLLTKLASPAAARSSAPPLPPLGQCIAIARDQAFAFLYTHQLRDWQAAGASLSFFSPLADEAPVADADAVFLPGGYPELHGPLLASNIRFKAGLIDAAARGALVYGECGGFMVLGQGIVDREGARHEMTGLLPHETRIDRPRRVLGYRRLSHQSPLPYPAALNGHEFHYSSAKQQRGTPLFAAVDALGEAQPPMGLVEGRVMGSYAHVVDRAS